MLNSSARGAHPGHVGRKMALGMQSRLPAPICHLPPTQPSAPPLRPVPSRSSGEADFPGKIRQCVGSCFTATQSDDVGRGLLCLCPQLAAERLLPGEPAQGWGAPGLRSSREERGTCHPRAVLLHCKAAAAQSCPVTRTRRQSFRKVLTKLCWAILL